MSKQAIKLMIFTTIISTFLSIEIKLKDSSAISSSGTNGTSNDSLYNISCANNNQCGNGTCINQTCECYIGYVSNSSTFACQYEQKLQLKAFLFELFLGFGVGHFYTYRYTHAALKLTAFLFGIYIICLFPLSAKCISEKCNSEFLVFMVSCLFYLMAVGLAFWFIYDLLMFGLNNYKDGNGMPLRKWGK